MRAYIALLVVILLVFSGLAEAQGIRPTERITDTRQDIAIENPKIINQLLVRIVQSGTLSISGSIERANLTLVIPQDASSVIIEAGGGTNTIIRDRFGNKIVFLEWKKPAGPVSYSVESVVNSVASFLESEKPLSSSSSYLEETDSIIISPEIRKYAYFFENSMEGAADMTQFVNDYMVYDISVVGERESSKWAFENKRGVCVEHANLLTAMLRSQKIPTRYVVGYAYSSLDKKLIGHTWVEVQASDGSWIPFDPTWLEGGFLDATHIRTGTQLDDNQKDVLSYVGSGSVQWQRNDDEFNIINYAQQNITSLGLESSPVSITQKGLIKATVTPATCTFIDLSVNSCVDQRGDPLIEIKDKQRKFWTCTQQDIYWVYDISSSVREGYKYTCPIFVYDQSGTVGTTTIEISGTSEMGDVFFSGPETGVINEKLSFQVPEGAIFFSPSFAAVDPSDILIKRPGSYTFYAYMDGNYDEKHLTIAEKKEFSLRASAPQNVVYGSNFTVNVSITNIQNIRAGAVLTAEYSNQAVRKEITLNAGETRDIPVIFAAEPGTKKLTVSVLSDTLETYSSYITVPEKKTEKGILDAIFGFFASIIGGIKSLFG